jgi:predicted secreted protein with PEFG-CTERM motif
VNPRLYVPFTLSIIAIIAIVPQAFADTAITISKGDSADQSCVTAKNCYNPDVVTVAPGTTVTWTNADSVSHTVTSGNPSDNQTGTVFDSSLVRPSATYSFTFKDPGMYNYFCQVHPWMTGQVIVVAGSSNTASSNVPEFGSFATIILAIAVTGIVAFGAKRAIISKL